MLINDIEINFGDWSGSSWGGFIGLTDQSVVLLAIVTFCIE
jgi:hypothetical protein